MIRLHNVEKSYQTGAARTHVLRQVNLPVEGIGLIIGIDRLLDMVRTAVNITGDAAVTCVVARSEGQLDDGVFEDRSV